ncbi:MAG TPA: hypothetical protein VGC08_16110 [Pedobacter sp.]
MSNSDVTAIVLTLCVLIALTTIYFTFIKKNTDIPDNHSDSH